MTSKKEEKVSRTKAKPTIKHIQAAAEEHKPRIIKTPTPVASDQYEDLFNNDDEDDDEDPSIDED